MQAKTRIYLLVLMASLSGSMTTDAAELWEIFAPTTDVSAVDAPVNDAPAESQEPAVEIASGAKDATLPEAIQEPNDERVVWVGTLGNQPAQITPTVFASDHDTPELTEPRLLSAEPIVEPPVLPAGKRELWAIFAPANDHATDVPKVKAFAPAEVLLESGEVLRVTQAVEELPEMFSPTLTLPSVSELDAEIDAGGLSRSIYQLTLDAAVRPELMEGISNLDGDRAIKDLAVERFGSWEMPQYEASIVGARFDSSEVHWAAPAFYSRPLYFEQTNLERYGHHVAFCDHDNLTQSAISAAHFFVTVPALPYALGANSPDECSYVLGSYRPGSCNPHQLIKPPLSLRGLVFEGVAATGLVFFIP